MNPRTVQRVTCAYNGETTTLIGERVFANIYRRARVCVPREKANAVCAHQSFSREAQFASRAIRYREMKSTIASGLADKTEILIDFQEIICIPRTTDVSARVCPSTIQPCVIASKIKDAS